MDNFLIVLEVVLIAMLLLIIFVPVILLFTNWDSVSNFFSLYLQKKLSGVTSETNKDSSQPKAQKQSEIIQKEKPVEEKITLINEENESVEIQKKKKFNLVSKTINPMKNIATKFFSKIKEIKSNSKEKAISKRRDDIDKLLDVDDPNIRLPIEQVPFLARDRRYDLFATEDGNIAVKKIINKENVIATLNSQKEKPNQIKVNTVESKDKAVVQIEEPRSIKNLFVVNQDFFAYNLNDQFVFSRDELSWKIIDNKEKSVVVSGEFNDENSEEQEKSLEEMKEAMRRYSKKSSDDESEEIELITTIENFKEIKIIVPSEEEEELKDDQDKRSAKNNNSTQKQASQKPLAPKEKETPLVPINKNNQKPKVEKSKLNTQQKQVQAKQIQAELEEVLEEEIDTYEIPEEDKQIVSTDTEVGIDINAFTEALSHNNKNNQKQKQKPEAKQKEKFFIQHSYLGIDEFVKYFLAQNRQYESNTQEFYKWLVVNFDYVYSSREVGLLIAPISFIAAIASTIPNEDERNSFIGEFFDNESEEINFTKLFHFLKNYNATSTLYIDKAWFNSYKGKDQNEYNYEYGILCDKTKIGGSFLLIGTAKCTGQEFTALAKECDCLAKNTDEVANFKPKFWITKKRKDIERCLIL